MADHTRRRVRSSLETTPRLVRLAPQVAVRQARADDLTVQTLAAVAASLAPTGAHGAESPLQPSPAGRSCQTCGRPVRVRYRGRCPTCYRYWRRTGRERPSEWWQR